MYIITECVQRNLNKLANQKTLQQKNEPCSLRIKFIPKNSNAYIAARIRLCKMIFNLGMRLEMSCHLTSALKRYLNNMVFKNIS